MNYNKKELQASKQVITSLFPMADEKEIEHKAMEMLEIAYSIGSSYDAKQLQEIAKTYWKLT